MYAELYAVLESRLDGLGLLNVGSGLADPPPLPAVQLFLSSDHEVTERSPIIREITHGIKVTVAHSDTAGASQTEVMEMLDVIRDGFAGWIPAELDGVQGACSMPSIALSDYKDHGSIEYICVIKLRVIPSVFKQNTGASQC